MNQPLVSVIIPAYDAEKFIEETIRSVINQSYNNIECIIIDDGSPDNLGHIVKNLIAEDDRIIYIRQENKGVSSARNHGFKLSKGKYISFLDADDVWKENRIKKTLNAFNVSDKSLGLVHTDMRFMDINANQMDQKNFGLSGYVLDDLLLWEKCVIPAPGSALIKRTVLNDIGLFNTSLSTSADQEIFMRICSKYKIQRIDEELGFSRIYETSMSRNNVQQIVKDHLSAYEIASQNNLFKSRSFKRKCFANLYLIMAGTLWKGNKNLFSSIKYTCLSIILHPPIIKKLLKKL